MGAVREKFPADNPAAGDFPKNFHPLSVASLAPSFPLALETPAEQIMTALKKAGFSVVEETASVLGLNWELRMKEREAKPFLIGSSCPKVVDLVHHAFPPLTDCLSRLPSPMAQHGCSLRRRYPRARLFFFSPCEAKIEENRTTGVFDRVLPFSALVEILAAADLGAPDSRRRMSYPPPPVEARLAVLNSPVSGEKECLRFLQEALAPGFRETNPGYHDLAFCSGGCAGKTEEQYPEGDTAEQRLLRAWGIEV